MSFDPAKIDEYLNRPPEVLYSATIAAMLAAEENSADTLKKIEEFLRTDEPLENLAAAFQFKQQMGELERESLTKCLLRGFAWKREQLHQEVNNPQGVFDNAEEIARELAAKTLAEKLEQAYADAKKDSSPGSVFGVIERSDESNAKEILELCLAQLDKYENIVVLRFNERTENGNCAGIEGDTMMSLKSRHAAMHAAKMLSETSHSVAETIMQDAAKQVSERLKENFKQKEYDG